MKTRNIAVQASSLRSIATEDGSRLSLTSNQSLERKPAVNKMETGAPPVLLWLALLLLTLNPQLSTCLAQNTAFTYQGRLNDGANPASGIYDLRFTIYDSNGGPGLVAGPLTPDPATVSNGLFTVTLDFGAGVFTGAERWLEIGVRTNGGGAFTPLSPQQALTATPYAIHAAYAGDIEAGANVVFSGGTVTFAANPPFLLGPFATNTVTGLSAQFLGGKDAGQFWNLGGNSGQSPGSYVLGTLDNNPLELMVNGQRALRLEPGTSGAVNVTGGAANNTIATGNASATIGGGYANAIAAPNSDNTVIAGGNNNSIQAGSIESVISGGLHNSVQSNAFRSVIAGGMRNQVDAASTYSTISGGQSNRVLSFSSFANIGGGHANWIDFAAEAATIAGGRRNLVAVGSTGAVVGGGRTNAVAAYADGATIAGGHDNTINSYSPDATIGGGGGNTVANSAGNGSTIAGGNYNTIDEGNYQAAIAGGAVNHIFPYADTSVIGGGSANEVRGSHGVIPGGRYNQANGAFSFAAGYDARALHDGCFVWSDPNTPLFASATQSTGTNQFVIRASGGVQVYPNTSLFFGSQTRQMLNLWGEAYGLGVQASSLYFRCNNGSANDGFIWYRGGVHDDGYANPGGGTEMMHLVPGGLYVNGALVSSSDRNAKENFRPVDPRAVLAKVAALPLSEWNYKSDAATRHLGPMAQDFRAAFGLGSDDKHIATVDADGVALAAIQGLNQKLEETRAENAALKRELQSLKHLVGTLAVKLNGDTQ